MSIQGNVKFKIAALSIATLSVALLFQNCGNPAAFQAIDTDRGEPNLTENVDTQTGGQPLQYATKECEFLDVESLSSILRNQFGIAAGDLPMRDPNGNVLRSQTCGTNPSQVEDCYYLRDNAAGFGKGDMSRGIPDDYSCSTPKYKLVAELFVHACDQAARNPSVVAGLFPQGINNFDNIYSLLVGRRPYSRENETLQTLVNSVSSGVAELAVCAVVASSLEAVSKL